MPGKSAPKKRSGVKTLPAGSSGSKKSGGKPGGTSEKYARSMKRLAQTGRPRDAVDALMEVISD